jgi:hypothetical protein
MVALAGRRRITVLGGHGRSPAPAIVTMVTSAKGMPVRTATIAAA